MERTEILVGGDQILQTATTDHLKNTLMLGCEEVEGRIYRDPSSFISGSTHLCSWTHASPQAIALTSGRKRSVPLMTGTGEEISS